MRSVKTPAPLGPTASQPASPVRPKTGAKKDEDDTAVWSLKHIQVLWSWAARPARAPYPAISSIPPTSAERLSEPDVSPSLFPSEPILANSFHQDAPAKPKTVLYLAYGSNMCAETFLGMRGIRPLSQVNVSAPSLDLTFDLPGIPYREPCFANTALRKIPGAKPPFDPPKFPPGVPDRPAIEPPFPQASDEPEDEPTPTTPRAGPTWTKGLYGIVYEVTAEDYAKILATEGGGASYHDILVPCLVLPPSIRVPEQPSLPPPPRPFLAHTLFAPRLPDLPDPSPPTAGDGGGDDPTPEPAPKLPGWLASLLRPVRRPSASYAQPSARYLKLLRDGAREHDLPADYQAHLARLAPYTATTRRQKLGQVLFLGFWAPLVILMMVTGRVFADERGRSPGWVVAGSTVLFNLVWRSYDGVGRGVFGDGERTIEGSAGAQKRRGSFASGLRGVGEVGDEEKRALMDGYQ
ncbi:hypothetical protein C8A05DRAFT_42420 [Staphylotrichum tortipilum]|uniref:gamma-glutamylcyclotransferase n=1 Tax=Staphylotrichum tortipilum TaxID=2831512 RepID=A0AAN6RVQ0_9PEZI|nr:hypothetical protein C8A05DRAFT_42420 [Staphylotrichum longicolle]